MTTIKALNEINLFNISEIPRNSKCW